MKKVTSKLTIEQQKELETLATLSDEQINTDDMPEVTDWSDAKRGLFYSPIQEEITEASALEGKGQSSVISEQ
ncbi:MAG: hypothetical protein AB4041_11040 [Microcystaceae cyanobacterium]